MLSLTIALRNHFKGETSLLDFQKELKDLSVEDRQWFADAFSGAGVEVDPESISKKPA